MTLPRAARGSNPGSRQQRIHARRGLALQLGDDGDLTLGELVPGIVRRPLQAARLDAGERARRPRQKLQERLGVRDIEVDDLVILLPGRFVGATQPVVYLHSAPRVWPRRNVGKRDAGAFLRLT